MASPRSRSWSSVPRAGATSTSPTVADESGVDAGRILHLDDLDAADLAVVIGGALAFVAPSHDEGSGTALIEAFSLGTPVIHSDAPAFVEVSAGAGLTVPVGTRMPATPTGSRPRSRPWSSDRSLAERLSVAGQRPQHGRSAGATPAERVWQLHADL